MGAVAKPGAAALTRSIMSSDSVPLASVLGWLAHHAGFPHRRLNAAGERMLCVAALAAQEERIEQERYALQRRDPAQTSALRSLNQRRTQVHFKCDNSAKV